MGKSLRWVCEEPSGRLFYRRAYPSDLRAFLSVPKRELKVSLRTHHIMTQDAFSLYDQAKWQFNQDVKLAEAAQERHQKAADGARDVLNPATIKYLADVFTRQRHLADETSLRTRGGDWADRAREAWRWLLDDFRRWRVEGDTEAMEEHWGRQADALIAEEGLLVDPADHDGRSRLLWALNDAALAMSEDAQARLKGQLVPVPPEVDRPASSKARARTVMALLDAYRTAKWDGWSQSSRTAIEPVFRLLRDVLGDREVRAVDRDAARSLLGLVKALPSGLGRRGELKGLTVQEAIEEGSRLGFDTIRPGTANRGYMVHVSAIFGWAIKEDWTDKNPFIGLAVADPIDAKDKRDPFTADQLQTLFSADPWASPASCDDPRPGAFWVPLIALFTGARLGEIAGLRVMDIEQIDGVPALRVRPHEHRGLKNRDSRRDIPVHSALLRLGLMAFVAHRKKQINASDLIFPDGKANVRRQSGAKLGERFGRLLKDRGITGTKLGIHSFRHNFEDRLRSAGLHGRSEGLALAGRAVSGSEGDYGHGFTMAALRDALERVTYPGLDLTHLEPV